MYITGINLSKVDTNPEFAVGQLGQTHDGKIYKYLQYSDGTGNLNAAVNDVAFYVGATGKSTGICSVDQSDAAGIGAGIAQAVMTDLQYGWFQVRGVATVSTALGGSAADGDGLTPDGTGAADRTLTVAAAADDGVCAMALDASALLIDCQFAL